jgi:hypothetical protein
MRRLTSYTGIMLLSLLVSGWSNLFAAAFCPHVAGNKLPAMMRGMDDRSCHRESAEQTRHSEAHQPAMKGMLMMPAAQKPDSGTVVPVGQFSGTCSHCAGQDSSPRTAASSRELSLQKGDAGAAIEKSVMPVALHAAFFSPKFIATQNSPPGAANRKHLLLGVFLI